ncbi:hypothetical protein BDM02DRAFT_1114059 [Thelephora ganbajun]|uniref:Uncharacterized protein n=1 Tax=Thelephora ganbajun TaxID=370292 RepID=A0ACB6ZW86_THEGA|nr:hypothetical protein BDM02DRAFT_1114059 [Thelephora ganbajun]
MNYVDAIDLSGTNTPPVNAEDPPAQTLNEEVNQVIGQLSSFWGGFRKQSQIAFQSARKDFGEVVQQAQKELTKLTAEPSSSSTADAPQPEASTSSIHTTTQDEEPREEDSEEGESESDNESTSSTIAPATSTNAGFSAQSIFTRLQSSIPPNLVSTVQSNIHIPPSIRHAASGSVDFSQLKNTLTTEFTRVQDITRAQAEEYVHKSEELLREAGEFLKDAVKVVPPESQGESVGVMWDGSDVWMLPAMGASIASERTLGASTSGTEPSSMEGTRAVATRAEELLRRLRRDDTVIKADPEGEEMVKTLYDGWISDHVEPAGGIEGEEWLERRKLALDAEGVSGLKDSVVPSSMTEEVFWIRYFFRLYQIEREAERRKALLQGTSDSEDIFSWEDDDEEPSSAPVQSIPSLQNPTITHSPRESSEESYDVVSGRNSGENVKKDAKSTPTSDNEAGEDSDSGGSDWE